MSKSTWELISEDWMTYINCMTKMELPAESHEAGNYIHKKMCVLTWELVLKILRSVSDCMTKIELPAE